MHFDNVLVLLLSGTTPHAHLWTSCVQKLTDSVYTAKPKKFKHDYFNVQPIGIISKKTEYTKWGHCRQRKIRYCS